MAMAPYDATPRKRWQWALALLLTCLSVLSSVASTPQEAQVVGVYELGKKSGAAVPSFAVSGAGTVVTVHGLNFAPGGE